LRGFKSGFLVGFGSCLILLGTFPFLFFMLGVLLQPSHPASRTLLGIPEFLKSNPYLYIVVTRVYDLSRSLYNAILTSQEFRLCFAGMLVAGLLLVCEGINILRKGKS